MARPILIGEAPAGEGHEPQPSLEGAVGRTLSRMLRVSYEEYLEAFDRRNIFETPVEGRRWSAPRAKLRAMGMAGMFRDDDYVVLLGARVAEAFGMSDRPLYEMIRFQRVWSGEMFWVGRVPHPSGRNRVLNDPRERDKMSRFLIEAMNARR